MPLDILIITAIHALIQIAALMLLARGLMWLLGPRMRQGNFFYDIFTIGTAPFVALTRRVAPRALPDVYIPTTAFVLLLLLSVGVGLAKYFLCAARALQCV